MAGCSKEMRQNCQLSYCKFRMREPFAAEVGMFTYIRNPKDITDTELEKRIVENRISGICLGFEGEESREELPRLDRQWQRLNIKLGKGGRFADQYEDEETLALLNSEDLIDPRELRAGEFGDTATTIIRPENRPGER